MAAIGELGEVEAVSSLWETEPIGGPEQRDYLNAVLVLQTVLGPLPLIRRLHDAEKSRGRERTDRPALPRTLDLDLLLYGDASITTDEVTVPHPRIGGRRFVLEPLAEVLPGIAVPGRGPVDELLGGVRDQRCDRVEDPEWADSR